MMEIYLSVQNQLRNDPTEYPQVLQCRKLARLESLFHYVQLDNFQSLRPSEGEQFNIE